MCGLVSGLCALRMRSSRRLGLCCRGVWLVVRLVSR
jgi:hypothetical protein